MVSNISRAKYLRSTSDKYGGDRQRWKAFPWLDGILSENAANNQYVRFSDGSGIFGNRAILRGIHAVTA